MSTTISTILLWLFVINLGIAFGAGLYEHASLHRVGSTTMAQVRIGMLKRRGVTIPV